MRFLGHYTAAALRSWVRSWIMLSRGSLRYYCIRVRQGAHCSACVHALLTPCLSCLVPLPC